MVSVKITVQLKTEGRCERLNQEKNSLNGEDKRENIIKYSEVKDERLREMIDDMKDRGIRSNLHLSEWADKGTLK